MKVWGTGYFENDIACEWLGSIRDGDVQLPAEQIRSALGNAARRELTFQQCAELYAAIAVVVGAADPRLLDRLPPEALVWFQRRKYTPSAESIELCRSALGVLMAPDSAFVQYWQARKQLPDLYALVDLLHYGLDAVPVPAVTRIVPPRLHESLRHVYHPKWSLSASLKSFALVTCIFIVLMVPFEIRELMNLHAAPDDADLSMLSLANDSVLYVFISMVYSIAYIVTIPLLITFLVRTHHNLPRLGSLGLKYKPAMAGWYFLIPYLNLYMPYRVVQDAWRASNPDTDPACSTAWQRTGQWRLIGVWWGLWLVSSIVGLLLTSLPDATSVGSATAEQFLFLAMKLLILPGFILMIIIMLAIQERQEARHDALCAYAGRFGLTVGQHVTRLAQEYDYRQCEPQMQPQVVAPSQTDHLRTEKFCFLGATILYASGLVTFFAFLRPNDDSFLSVFFTLVIIALYITAMWRTFFGEVHHEKWTCFGLVVLLMTGTAAILIGTKVYTDTPALILYLLAIGMHGWLVSITVRDALRWRHREEQ